VADAADLSQGKDDDPAAEQNRGQRGARLPHRAVIGRVDPHA
jgi:hypothetical protein